MRKKISKLLFCLTIYSCAFKNSNFKKRVKMINGIKFRRLKVKKNRYLCLLNYFELKKVINLKNSPKPSCTVAKQKSAWRRNINHWYYRAVKFCGVLTRSKIYGTTVPLKKLWLFFSAYFLVVICSVKIVRWNLIIKKILQVIWGRHQIFPH